ncbi:MAG: alpha/beta hydrolase [Kyrpidia tusciae]|nr:alpha/beta hydrolase [Kyrpidia tusciae]MBE3551864.1 alpha/beta hydrolase [Kyrpidia tusciae]
MNPEDVCDPNTPSQQTPLDALRIFAIQKFSIQGDLAHYELYTRTGLLTIFWHGQQQEQNVVLMTGGALGGLLGPGNGVYHKLGDALSNKGIGAMRVACRHPGQLAPCVLDIIAAMQLAVGNGAKNFILVGHSFGGAVVIQAAVAMPQLVKGVVTLATQSAGCEGARGLQGRPFLLIHGANDEILPLSSSEMVQSFAGCGELVVLPNSGHLLQEDEGELYNVLFEWIKNTITSIL